MLTPDDILGWEAAREQALDRDGHRCSVSRLLGGTCTSRLDVHHLIPRCEGGSDELDNLLTACSRHHPMLEALRRGILSRRQPKIPACRHRHRYDHARRECYEKRLAQAA